MFVRCRAMIASAAPAVNATTGQDSPKRSAQSGSEIAASVDQIRFWRRVELIQWSSFDAWHSLPVVFADVPEMHHEQLKSMSIRG